MNISFTPLNKTHFLLMLKWLELPHIKKWWDQDIVYTLNLVREKYGKYIHEQAITNKLNNKTYAYIISLDNKEIAYIQVYNAYEFARTNDLKLLSGSLCGVDLFIGETNYLYQGIGALILNKFTKQVLAPNFDWCLIDPVAKNKSAIRAFKKAGFKIIKGSKNNNITILIKKLRKF